MVNVIIPIAPYEYLDNRVIQSIDIPHQLIVQVSESRHENPSWIDRIINARNMLRAKTTSEFVLCMDSDVVLLAGILAHGLNEIQSRPHLGMLGIPTYMGAQQDPLGHVKIKCAYVRGELLRSIPFRYTEMQCECICFARDIGRLGYRSIYLETDQYCQILDNRKDKDAKNKEKHPETSSSPSDTNCQDSTGK